MTKHNYNPKEYIKKKEQKFTNEMINDTLKYQKQYGFEIGDNSMRFFARCLHFQIIPRYSAQNDKVFVVYMGLYIYPCAE